MDNKISWSAKFDTESQLEEALEIVRSKTDLDRIIVQNAYSGSPDRLRIHINEYRVGNYFDRINIIPDIESLSFKVEFYRKDVKGRPFWKDIIVDSLPDLRKNMGADIKFIKCWE